MGPVSNIVDRAEIESEFSPGFLTCCVISDKLLDLLSVKWQL